LFGFLNVAEDTDSTFFVKLKELPLQFAASHPADNGVSVKDRESDRMDHEAAPSASVYVNAILPPSLLSPWRWDLL
jgi:hypothetical protein